MFKNSLIALAALGAGLVGYSTVEASAFPAQSAPALQAGAESSLLVTVNHGGKHWKKWNRKYHGGRHHYRSGRYRHYHDGYWYENPWWIMPMIGAGIVLSDRDYYYDDDDYGYGSRHVRWCLDRYRSYNVRTNTWVSYSGRLRECISPYGP